jgi:hypothetical protein
MNQEALTYFHRMRRAGFTINGARHSTILMFTRPADFERRMLRYPLESTMEQGATCGSQAEAIRALDRRFEQIKKGGGFF